MLTNDFYVALASALKADVEERVFLAVGEGDPAWDEMPPSFRRDTTLLVNELARKAITAENIHYVDEAGNETETPSARLRLQTSFSQEEGVGTLRECGLFTGAASSEAGSGTLISYFVHQRIEKLADADLMRSITLDITPRASGPGQIATRFLGNSGSRELHDLDNETSACQINEIRFDNRFYFGSPEQAVGLGYDYCAFCFGRELSQR